MRKNKPPPKGKTKNLDLIQSGFGKSESTSGSSISISIESALGCFDFLNTAIDNVENEELENANDRLSENHEMKAVDRCLKCDGETMNDVDKRHSKLDMNALNISSGKEDIDLVITDHLLYCTRLVSMMRMTPLSQNLHITPPGGRLAPSLYDLACNRTTYTPGTLPPQSQDLATRPPTTSLNQ
ncbi:hypothetical protein AVEN_20218-1 [Araneus ventricosus]|uniref:Uncharacterized protein n=1 Tax=Araneus ventricosus TaxID=182803 RepID=A0A4Y2CK66_ARAVE|nr:hypothetical protein AVEN_20218-1 [Araneus ventricosus]